MSLAALPKLLIDSRYRQEILKSVADPAVRTFFQFYESQGDRLREESIAPLLNKVSRFTANPLLCNVIGQTTSSFDFRWLIDSNKILPCDLSKGPSRSPMVPNRGKRALIACWKLSHV